MSLEDIIPKSTIPEGTDGEFSVERFTVSEFESRMSMIHDGRRGVFPGEYTRLKWRDETYMSDTPAELYDHLEFVRTAHGKVLIHGLGLGVCLAAILRNPLIYSVTVVEKAPEVIRLVGRHLSDDRLTIIEGDAFTWKFPKDARWDVAWHDIWLYICTDNLAEMTKLKRRFARRVGWQKCWAEAECRYNRALGR